MNYSNKFEKKVTVQTYKPTAASLLALLKEHDESTDTELSEWTVDIETVLNEPTNIAMAPLNRYRWEITLTRSINK